MDGFLGSITPKITKQISDGGLATSVSRVSLAPPRVSNKCPTKYLAQIYIFGENKNRSVQTVFNKYQTSLWEGLGMFCYPGSARDTLETLLARLPSDTFCVFFFNSFSKVYRSGGEWLYRENSMQLKIFKIDPPGLTTCLFDLRIGSGVFF